MPIVRTFAPIIGRRRPHEVPHVPHVQHHRRCRLGRGVTLAGYWLGQIDVIKKNIEAIIVLIVILSVVPIIIEYLRERGKKKRLAAEARPPARSTSSPRSWTTPRPSCAASPRPPRSSPAQQYGDQGGYPQQAPQPYGDQSGYPQQQPSAPGAAGAPAAVRERPVLQPEPAAALQPRLLTRSQGPQAAPGGQKPRVRFAARRFPGGRRIRRNSREISDPRFTPIAMAMARAAALVSETSPCRPRSGRSQQTEVRGGTGQQRPDRRGGVRQRGREPVARQQLPEQAHQRRPPRPWTPPARFRRCSASPRTPTQATPPFRVTISTVDRSCWSRTAKVERQPHRRGDLQHRPRIDAAAPRPG